VTETKSGVVPNSTVSTTTTKGSGSTRRTVEPPSEKSRRYVRFFGARGVEMDKRAELAFGSTTMNKHIRVPIPDKLHDELRHLAVDLHVPLYQLLVDGAELLPRKHREGREVVEQAGTVTE
jgi:hypothetical protein